jgi:hypothetical protein
MSKLLFDRDPENTKKLRDMALTFGSLFHTQTPDDARVTYLEVFIKARLLGRFGREQPNYHETKVGFEFAEELLDSPRVKQEPLHNLEGLRAYAKICEAYLNLHNELFAIREEYKEKTGKEFL